MKFTFREKYQGRYPEDVEKIRAFLETKGDLEATNREIEKLWDDFSDTYSAGWLSVDDDLLDNFWWFFCKRLHLEYDYENEEDYDEI